MTFGIYSIRDAKTGFMTPVCEVSDEVAIRNFSHTVQVSDGLLQTHPGDFDFYKLGTFDSDTGMITMDTLPVQLFTATDAIGLA